MKMVEPVVYFNAKSPVSSVCFIENGKSYLIGGTICGALKVWDLANCNELQTIQLFSTPILWMSTINQDKLIVQARFDVSVRVFEMEHNRFEEKVSLNLESPHCGFCSGDIIGNYVVLPTSDSNLTIYEWTSSFELDVVCNYTSDSSMGSLTALKLIKIKERVCLLVAHECASIFLYNFSHHKIDVVANIKIQGEDFIPFALDFDSSNLTCVVGGSSDEILSIKYLCEENELKILNRRKMPTKGVSKLSIRKSDSKVLIGGGWDGNVKLFSWLKPEKLKPLGALKFHSGAIDCISTVVCPLNYLKVRGHLLAAGSKDGKISLWSLYN